MTQKIASMCLRQKSTENFWRWRMRMARHIAEQIDAQRFGIVGLYLIGSAKNATAGPGSDIDLLVHVRNSKQQQQELLAWLKNWSLCLDEMNYRHTGYRSDGLLDVHLVTDDDIAQKTSFAIKIDAITDAACPLPMKSGLIAQERVL